MITNSFRQKLGKLAKLARSFSTLAKATSSTPAKSDRLQFTKARLTDFGELPQGQIPEALRYDRPSNLTKLKNGIRVATESGNGNVTFITVTVKAGTRQETLTNSTVCQFLEALHFRGTNGRTREQIEQELVKYGGSCQVNTGRELTTYTLAVQPSEVEGAVAFLGDILTNSVYAPQQVEAERENVYLKSVRNTEDQMAATIENVHQTSFRDHYISQPILGVRENASNVTAEQIKDFHDQHYVGSNIVVSATGNVNHEALAGAVEKAFGKLPQSGKDQHVPNAEKPYFTPSMMYIRDDEMTNINIGVFFEAPKYNHPDFFGMMLLREVMGEYRSDMFTGKHLNASDRQYSTMHKHLGDFPDITLHRCEYLPYSDTGLFGSYLYGNEVFGNQMLYMSQTILTEYAAYMQQAELYRARNSLYNKLLTDDSCCASSACLGSSVMYFDRIVPRSEVAQRLSHYDTGLLNRMASRWFWDKELSIVAWGAIHGLMTYSHYNRPIRRSSLGWYGDAHYNIV